MMKQTPLTFLFLIVYCSLAVSLFSLPNFITLWISMELLTFTFMGFSYSLCVSSISNLMSYFLIQSVSSFSILISVVLDSHPLFLFFFSLKMGMFPFYFWWINCMVDFPSSVLFMSMTVQKLPLLLALLKFPLADPTAPLFWSLILLSMVVGGLFMVISSNLRVVLVASSIASSSWFLLASLSSFEVFLLYYFVYSSLLLCLLFLSPACNNPSLTPPTAPLLLTLLSISGLPPLPLFYPKFLVIMALTSFYSTFLISLALFLTVLSMLGYIQFALSSVVKTRSSLMGLL